MKIKHLNGAYFRANIYRFDHSKLGEWDDSWKTQNDSEGVGKKATFHIYKNNTYAADYKHTRSFK